jgi:hypothetical protein
VQAKDYYELLGVSRRASQATLRHAFRTRMLDLHPDLHPDDALACQHTREILDAYETLGNPASRRAYDKDLAELEAEELNWRYVGTEECAPLTHQVLLFILAALAIVVLIWAVRAVLDSRSPVYRFQLTELWADNQPTVYLRWTMGITDSGWTYCGWNIDDVEIWGVAAQPYPVGDLNCDGNVDFGDINPFVLALTNPAGYAVQFPNCDIRLGDINADGRVDFGDINPFVRLLTNP